MEKEIYFDCDGTWVDLYGVPGWREDLDNCSARPFIEAKPLINLSYFARLLHKAQSLGYKIGIITWLPPFKNEQFAAEVYAAKMAYFKKHLPSIQWDAIHIIPYGTPKSNCGDGILFDDEERNRKEWNGTAYRENQIFEILRAL